MVMYDPSDNEARKKYKQQQALKKAKDALRENRPKVKKAK